MRNDHNAKAFSVVSSVENNESPDPTHLAKLRLKELAERLDETHTFSKGQFIRWKPGLKNKRSPEYGEPAIVIGVLPRPIYESTETSGSPYFMEPLSIIIGLYLDEDLVEFHVDGRRFEPAT